MKHTYLIGIVVVMRVADTPVGMDGVLTMVLEVVGVIAELAPHTTHQKYMIPAVLDALILLLLLLLLHLHHHHLHHHHHLLLLLLLARRASGAPEELNLCVEAARRAPTPREERRL